MTWTPPQPPEGLPEAVGYREVWFADFYDVPLAGYVWWNGERVFHETGLILENGWGNDYWRLYRYELFTEWGSWWNVDKGGSLENVDDEDDEAEYPVYYVLFELSNEEAAEELRRMADWLTLGRDPLVESNYWSKYPAKKERKYKLLGTRKPIAYFRTP